MKSLFFLNEEKYADNINWGKIHGPVYAYIEVTKRCNCNCKYCQVAELHDTDKDMDFSLFKKSIRQLKKVGILEIRLGGGEPLLLTDLERRLSYLKKKNLACWICTNGTLLTKEKAFLLKQYGVVGVRISIDSHKQETHDKMRGRKGSYLLAWKAVKNSVLSGLNTVISMTLGEHNIKDVDKLYKMAIGHGAKFITHPIMPIGRGKTFVSKGEFFCLSNENKKLVQKTSGEKHCVALTETLGIDSLGNVSACTFLPSVDNIKNRSLKKILKDERMAKYARPIPKSIKCKICKRGELIDGDCMFSDICRGGCWALKYTEEKKEV